jgi:hypothetical protein
MDYVVILISTFVFIIVSKYYYLNGPFRIWGNKEPKFVWFPKYNVKFDQPLSNITASLEKIGFVQSEGIDTIYNRGKIYGDFFAKHILLQVEISEDKKSFSLCAKTFILFDTGDLWRVCNQVVSSNNP